ncbi:hypothetical protein FHW77_002873 [Agrobacterium sp. RC10-4-1]|uniref:phage tail terminator-like protein n=1 Tax=Agrobacterium sp. RC10-4-1 TaxID=2587039 RepID=UPI0015FDEFFD|nr:phage tail terminator-like protein [Agrobacterium sp. RC10-4-1]MBA8799154.1 hypothetical protein [Agrobacterium sp. RC10-4-1]
MNQTNIELTLAADFNAAAGGWKVAFPNIPFRSPKPYVRFEIVRVSNRDDTLEGQAPISKGRIVATVVTEIGTKSKDANTKADQIAAYYPMGRRIPIINGEIVIIAPPNIQEGFPQDADWRTPVIIDYEAS